MFNNRRNSGPGFQNRPDDGKVPRHIHSPFTLEQDERTKASCDRDGKITITQTDEHDKEAYDEVIISAALIFKLANMLNSTRKTVRVTRESLQK